MGLEEFPSTYPSLSNFRSRVGIESMAGSGSGAVLGCGVDARRRVAQTIFNAREYFAESHDWSDRATRISKRVQHPFPRHRQVNDA